MLPDDCRKNNCALLLILLICFGAVSAGSISEVDQGNTVRRLLEDVNYNSNEFFLNN